MVSDEKHHRQCIAEDAYHPEWCGEARIPVTAVKPAKLDQRKVCGRRAAYLLKKGDHMNLGIGMPESVSAVAAEEGFSGEITLSVECGIYGGVPMGGLQICSAHNPDCIISHVSTFDIYDGGGIDVAVLGAAEVDEKGKNIKFKKNVEQISFSGEYAAETGKNILYITERAVFKLVKGGIELIEIAPGVDLQKDILEQMEFKPLISEHLKEMDACLFTDEPMGMKLPER